MKCIIVANGAYHYDYIPNNEFIIAVDGGYKYLKKQGLNPNLLIGDLDSVGRISDDLEIIKYNKEKDETDLFLAIKEAINRGFDELIIYGALGKRIEHTYANLSLLSYFNNIKITLVDQNVKCFVLNKNDIYNLSNEVGYLSIFSITHDAIITIQGLKYELNEAVINANFPLGIDNEAHGEPSFIKVIDGMILVITRFLN